ncbi:hypothetical protein Peur_017993 [Populus x canadensis]
MKADSLRYTSALAVALAVVFLVITAGITAVILVNGSANMPSGWEGLYYSKLNLVFASICYALEYGYWIRVRPEMPGIGTFSPFSAARREADLNDLQYFDSS